MLPTTETPLRQLYITKLQIDPDSFGVEIGSIDKDLLLRVVSEVQGCKSNIFTHKIGAGYMYSAFIGVESGNKSRVVRTINTLLRGPEQLLLSYRFVPWDVSDGLDNYTVEKLSASEAAPVILSEAFT